MPVSAANSQLVFDALKASGVRLMSALPETWLVHLIRLADDDPDVTLVRLAKEEEGVGISMGAHFAGVKSAMLMQNHGFLAAINGIVSGAREAGADAGLLGEQARRLAAHTRSDVGGRMTRLDCLRAIYDRLGDSAVVTIMGAVAAELQSIGHRPNFFYLQHAMGLASSVGLGIALSKPAVPVVVFDGDGSLLMNLGGLSTLARYRPANLVHVVFDNESLLSVGGFPTATGTCTRLAEVAAAAGVPRTACATTIDEFAKAFAEAQQARELTTLVAKVDAIGPAAFVTDLGLLENRFQFQRYLQGR
jgi:sulfopyruvate decarboxylase subunit beta